jgi:hypothetical protein
MLLGSERQIPDAAVGTHSDCRRRKMQHAIGNREAEHRLEDAGFRVRRIRHVDSIAQGGASDQIFGKRKRLEVPKP